MDTQDSLLAAAAQRWKGIGVALIAALAMLPLTAAPASAQSEVSGTLRDVQTNAPIAGAKVTLQRLDSGAYQEADPKYIAATLGDPTVHQAMIPTGPAGQFGWNVVSGWYKVRAEKPGCTDPREPQKLFVELGPLEVGPPYKNLVLLLKCTPDGDPPCPPENPDGTNNPIQNPGSVGGIVPSTLALTLGPPANFGSFHPGITMDYFASMLANVTSSAACTTLTVADKSSFAPGHLVNGLFVMPSALRTRAKVTQFVEPFANVATSPLSLHTWRSPVSAATATLEFHQPIAATDPLRTGGYSKSLTFELVAGP